MRNWGKWLRKNVEGNYYHILSLANLAVNKVARPTADKGIGLESSILIFISFELAASTSKITRRERVPNENPSANHFGWK